MVLKKSFSSFLFRLLSCFMIVISIFSIFQVITYNFYINSINSEIVQNNSTTLKNISDKFTAITTQVKNSLVLIYMEDEFLHYASVDTLNGVDIDHAVKRLFSATVNNSPYVKDIFLLQNNSDLVITAYGSHIKSQFFNFVYKEPGYTLDFWNKMFDSTDKFTMLSGKAFISEDFFNNESNFLIPVIFKPYPESKLIYVAMLDVNKIFKEIDPNMGQNISIYNNGKLLYPASSSIDINQPEFSKAASYYKNEGTYYFKQYSNSEDILYVKSISYKSIQMGIKKLSIVFFGIILLSILISLAISVIFSIRVNNPVKRIVDAISNGQPAIKLRTSINELNLINKSLQALVLENTNFSQDLNKKNSIIKSYFYQSRLKNIYSITNDMKTLATINSSYALICFIVHFKDAFKVQMGLDYSKATFFLSEYIQMLTEVNFYDSLTFQVEENQIVSIINLNSKSGAVYDLAVDVDKKMENENEYVFLTIAVGNVYEDVSELNTAYSEIIDISKHQKLSGETQILGPNDITASSSKIYFTSEQEQAFSNQLFNGNYNECIQLVNSILDVNYNKGVRLMYFQKLSTQLTNICVKTYTALNLDMPDTINFAEVYDKINKCFTLGDFKELFNNFLSQLTAPIIESKSKSDYIKDYVVDYIDKHYTDDIYLDLLSEKLNITSGYLSQYFKSKTGTNLSDYLNTVRLGKAKDMLTNSNEKIENIAQNVGYKNTNSFIRAFKKFSGLSPGEYRKTKLGATSK